MFLRIRENDIYNFPLRYRQHESIVITKPERMNKTKVCLHSIYKVSTSSAVLLNTNYTSW